MTKHFTRGGYYYADQTTQTQFKKCQKGATKFQNFMIKFGFNVSNLSQYVQTRVLVLFRKIILLEIEVRDYK